MRTKMSRHFLVTFVISLDTIKFRKTSFSKSKSISKHRYCLHFTGHLRQQKPFQTTKTTSTDLNNISNFDSSNNYLDDKIMF